MADFDYISGNPDNLTGGGAANMVDIQGPLVDLKEWINTDLQPRVAVAVPTFVTTLPTSATDGQEIYFLADNTNGVVWHLRYRAASASAYKWEFIGGGSLSSEVDTLEGSSLTTYVALATAGPAVTIPLAGDYMVEIGASIATTNANSSSYMSYDIGGTGAVDADAILVRTDTTEGNEWISVYRRRRKTIPAAATVLTSKYKAAGAAPGGNWSGRFMFATPIRVG